MHRKGMKGNNCSKERITFFTTNTVYILAIPRPFPSLIIDYFIKEERVMRSNMNKQADERCLYKALLLGVWIVLDSVCSLYLC